MKIRVNENFSNIKDTYLFSRIGERVRKYEAENPDKKVIRMGIGDVTLPLPSVVTDAMKKAAGEMGVLETFRGYPPEYGYGFLREAIVRHYSSIGAGIPADSVFVSDGAKSDIGNLVDILGDNEIVIPDPVYPVYVDSNTMSGRKITYVRGTIDNGFLPLPSEIGKIQKEQSYTSVPPITPPEPYITGNSFRSGCHLLSIPDPSLSLTLHMRHLSPGIFPIRSMRSKALSNAL